MRPASLKQRSALELFRLYRRIETSLHQLNYLFWECTLRCNLNCVHCGSDCKKDSSVVDMPIDNFVAVLDQIAKEYSPQKVMIAITGGEPLLRKDLEICGEKISKRGFSWGMVSNGFLLDSARIGSLLDAGLRSITISLDGLAESHNWMRGHRESYSRAIQAITLCSNAPVIVDVVTCVNQKNIGELDQIKSLLIDLGIKQWRLFTIFPKGRAAESPCLDITGSQLHDVLEFIAQCKSDKRIDANYGCEGFLGGYEGVSRNGLFFCRAGITIGSVLADGGISACPSLRGDYIQGNIYKDNFVECWKNRYDIMRNRAWTKTDKCSKCKEFKYCNGNALHLRDESSGELIRCHLR